MSIPRVSILEIRVERARSSTKKMKFLDKIFDKCINKSRMFPDSRRGK